MENLSQIDWINNCIGSLVYQKTQVKKAYNYYHCTRDPEQFRHIEEAYGLGCASTVGFTPLIKKHIDVLVGEYLELDPTLDITCKDQATLDNILRDKQLEIAKAVNEHLQKFLISEVQNKLNNSNNDQQQQQNNKDLTILDEIDRLKKSVAKNFISDYEIAAYNILEYCKESRSLDLKNKMRELFTDLLICGLCYYRVRPNEKEGNIKLEILNPVDTFISRNPNSFYLNKSSKAVVRRYLNEEQILTEYGSELSAEAKKKLLGAPMVENKNTDYFVHAETNVPFTLPTTSGSNGILGGLEVTPIYLDDAYGNYQWSNSRPLIEVYECEWIQVDKDGTQHLHQGVKLGGQVYITRGEVEDAPRSISNPKEVSLTINGMFFNDKNGQPYSLMLSTMDLQDRYDLLIFYRDNLLANSGVVGDWIDIAHLPTLLGDELPERIQKWLSYKKQGVGLYNSAQEGAQIINTTFNGFDDTIKAPTIQAIQLAMESIEQQASSITGVFREKLGGIQQRDAVSNVKVGVTQSTLLTKQYFHAMDLMFKEVNYDLLNAAKIAWKNGISGTLILGNRLNKIFTALPEHYTMTDYNVHIQDSADAIQLKQTMQQAGLELIKSNQADASMMINIAMSKNTRELKNYIEDSVAAKKEENNTIQQLQQQLQQLQEQSQQLQQQNQQLQKQNENFQKQLQKNNEAQLELEKQKVKLQEQSILNQKDYNDKIAETKQRLADIEIMQLTDGNARNDAVRGI